MIYAYTNFNLGDDLFIKLLCNRYPKSQFVLYAPKEYKMVFKEISNLCVIPNNTIFKKGINLILRLLRIKKNFFRNLVAKKCDAMVYIGGSLFMQDDNWIESYLDKKNMKLKNKPFFLLGANFGPFKDYEFYLKYKSLFKNYTDICFRDKYSYNLFKDLPNVRMADDIIFQLKIRSLEIKEEKEYIVISVIKPSLRKHLANYDEIYYKKIKDITIYFNAKGYRVILMSFCENEGDKEAVKEIIKLIPKENLKMVSAHYYKYDIEETLNIIVNCNFVVATRFHSMILGWLFEKTVFPIVYSEKMTNVMKDVGFTGLYTDFNQLDRLDPSEVYKSMQLNFIDVSDQVKNSEKHFEKLDEFLNK
jgi:colanic acid/amylovoran biosynthesis protein